MKPDQRDWTHFFEDWAYKAFIVTLVAIFGLAIFKVGLAILFLFI